MGSGRSLSVSTGDPEIVSGVVVELHVKIRIEECTKAGMGLDPLRAAGQKWVS
jgi:hypothetical protein